MNCLSPFLHQVPTSNLVVSRVTTVQVRLPNQRNLHLGVTSFQKDGQSLKRKEGLGGVVITPDT